MVLSIFAWLASGPGVGTWWLRDRRVERRTEEYHLAPGGPRGND